VLPGTDIRVWRRPEPVEGRRPAAAQLSGHNSGFGPSPAPEWRGKNTASSWACRRRTPAPRSPEPPRKGRPVRKVRIPEPCSGIRDPVPPRQTRGSRLFGREPMGVPAH